MMAKVGRGDDIEGGGFFPGLQTTDDAAEWLKHNVRRDIMLKSIGLLLLQFRTRYHWGKSIYNSLPIRCQRHSRSWRAAIIACRRGEDRGLTSSSGVADMTKSIFFLLPEIEVGLHVSTVAFPRREYGSCGNVHRMGLL